ncbi:MAG: hypothetical protein HQ485_14700 [Acidobacteria bacterium]|jgi:Zn-dependent protease with chaperone function|nr:hypothetical protein [Acidobacteriota bacterium]
MRILVVLLIQVTLAVLVSGLILPAVLFAVPETRTAGPLPLAVLVGILFLLLRLAWPRRRENT